MNRANGIMEKKSHQSHWKKQSAKEKINLVDCMSLKCPFSFTESPSLSGRVYILSYLKTFSVIIPPARRYRLVPEEKRYFDGSDCRTFIDINRRSTVRSALALAFIIVSGYYPTPSPQESSHQYDSSYVPGQIDPNHTSSFTASSSRETFFY